MNEFNVKVGWEDEDLSCALELAEVAVTDENLELLKNSIDCCGDTLKAGMKRAMIEAGWDFLARRIADVFPNEE